MSLQGKRAILYRRVSTDEQKQQGHSLSTQRDQLRNYCLNHGIEIVRDFEEHHSAKNFNRPEFNQLVRFIQQNRGLVDIILVTQWDRFSRNLGESLATIEQLRGMGLVVNAINNPLDLNDPYQYLSKVIQLAIPEGENLIRADRVKAGMNQGLKEGRYNNRPPKGYRSGRDELGKVLMQPDPTKAPLVALLFDEFSSGAFPQTQILKDIRFKPLGLTKSNLSRMLSNPVYAGIITVRAYRDQPEHQVIGLHEPLITMGVFQQVQNVLKSRKRIKVKVKKSSETLPLRGYLKCPKCGRNLTGSASKSKTGKKHLYYHCNPNLGCNHRLPASVHHDALKLFLQSIKPQPDIIPLYKAILEDCFKERNQKLFAEKGTLETELGAFERKKRALLD